jgi:hypothetical protein
MARSRDIDAVVRRYRETHWGIEPDQILEIDDEDLPAHLTMMGRLTEMEVIAPGGGRPSVLRFQGDCILAFDEASPSRLFCILTDRTTSALRRRFWLSPQAQKVPAIPLRQLARIDGEGRSYQGAALRQHRHPYADVRVKPLGICTRVVYETAKRDDATPRHNGARFADEFEPDLYEHHMGDESGHQPWIGLDEHGRLWWAGGNYHVPAGGITD